MEIVTLQFGHYSNFIGTHWWNIQESGFEYSNDGQSEINHDILYREGLTNKGDVTFTPRLLLTDLNDSLKHLSQYGDLYEPISVPETSSIPWPDSSVEVIKQDEHKPNKFQESLAKNCPDEIKTVDLEKEVNVWSDFLYARFHPRSVNLVKEYKHDSDTAGFDVFPLGTNYWANSEFSDEYIDKLRNYLEECDSCQGFQVILDGVNGFGGLGTSCIEYITDEYSKKSVLAFVSLPSVTKYSSSEEAKCVVQDSIRLINLTLCLDALNQHASLIVPISTADKGWRQFDKRKFNHVKYNSELYYHSSAILASALDTFTMPYRKKSSRFTVNDFCADLNSHSRMVAAASVSFPFAIDTRQDLIDCLDSWDGPLWQSITPNCELETDKMMQLVTMRGIPENRLKKPRKEHNKQMNMPAYRCNNVKEMLEFYLSCTSYATVSHVTSVGKPLPTKTPFPSIFDEFVSVNGGVDTEPRKTEQGVHSIPMIAGCHVGSSVGNMLESLHKEVSRIKFPRFHQFKVAGLETDDYKESLNRLLDLRYCYEEDFE